MNRFAAFVKAWMLPLAMATGITAYLVYHFTPALAPIGPACHRIASTGQPVLIGLMLFLQFIKISPHDLRFRWWHLWLLLFQAVSFVAMAFLTARTPPGEIRILLECAMLCLICPTAAAAGVITERLGGSLSGTVSYVVLINALATLLIPTVVPIVHPSADFSFWRSVWVISRRIFPMLLLPCLAAWTVRYTTKRLQRQLMRRAHWAFYLWGAGLTLALMLATRALVQSRLPLGVTLCIVFVSMGCCAVQFVVGRRAGARYGVVDKVTAGQSLGQKNTGFLIWLGYSSMTPVTSVAGGLYAIWQNLFNSWELYGHRTRSEPAGGVRSGGRDRRRGAGDRR